MCHRAYVSIKAVTWPHKSPFNAISNLVKSETAVLYDLMIYIKFQIHFGTLHTGTLSKLFSINLGVVVCLLPYLCLLSDKNVTQWKKSQTEMLINITW